MAKSKTKRKTGAKAPTPAVPQEPTARVCIGADAITADQAKTLLGWSAETEQVRFGTDYLLKDYHGVKVRCLNNVHNRPLYTSVVQTLKQEILRKRWRFNGEPIIVGKNGSILNGQHTLVALVLADQEWRESECWKAYWEDAPVIEKMIVYGVGEADEVVNTMDTCKPRSLTDVIYRSEYFAHIGSKDRRACARMADYAVRLLWHRTGATLDAFAPRRTHSESLDFINRHPKILEAVAHIYQEDRGKPISKLIPAGYAAGLLYLMGCSDTDPSEYQDAQLPNESLLDWSRWPEACDFWVALQADPKLAAARKMLLMGREHGMSHQERWAVVVKAWHVFLKGRTVSDSDLRLSYRETEDGVRILDECPVVGGIDVGDPRLVDESLLPGKDPTPQEIEQRAKQVREKRNGQKPKASTKRRPKLKPHKAGNDWAVGDVAWVVDPGMPDEPYLARIVDVYDLGHEEVAITVEDQDGNQWEARPDWLQLEPATTKTESANSPSPQKRKRQTAPKLGKTYWVNEPDGEPWRGKLMNLDGETATLKVINGFQGAGTKRQTPVARLSTEQPVRD